MAVGSLDIISILDRELRDHDVPASCIAKIAGVSSGRLSAYLNGTIQCSAQHQLALREAWLQLKKLIVFAAPLPLGFSKHKEVTRCIDMMERGVLQVVVIENESCAGEHQ